ncbi:hypothetical protein ACHAWU_006723 [Discostella pseudostelligera]|uniref:Large ribosomal subunit protein mL54 n=1 Tax=Discostella pseudostelligera TaxID=259834 RepID=A0ABD3LY86_9STRA
MISPRPIIIHRLLLQPLNNICQQLLPRRSTYPISTIFYSTTPTLSAMKPGTPIPGLDSIYPKAKDPSQSKVPTAKPRNEYPSWVFELGKPLPTLAKLKSMDIADATDKDMKRYLKLTRRARIKANNNERAKS